MPVMSCTGVQPSDPHAMSGIDMGCDAPAPTASMGAAVLSHTQQLCCGTRWIALPVMEGLLVVSFCMVNSVSRTVLNAIGACDSYYTDPGLRVERSFLQMDLRVECYTEEHDEIKAVGLASKKFHIGSIKFNSLSMQPFMVETRTPPIEFKNTPRRA